jgi:hypothetical protein
MSLYAKGYAAGRRKGRQDAQPAAPEGRPTGWAQTGGAQAETRMDASFAGGPAPEMQASHGAVGKSEAALQALVDQAQELDMGYGDSTTPQKET